MAILYGERKFEQLNFLIDSYPGEFIGIRSTLTYMNALHAYRALKDDYYSYFGFSRLWDKWLWFSTEFQGELLPPEISWRTYTRCMGWGDRDIDTFLGFS